jgi:sigma-E factor negative regulatory protein RseC
LIEQTGVVVSTDGHRVEVAARQQGSCGGCSQEGACGTSLIARYFGQRQLLLRAQDPIGVARGDHVVVGVPEDALLKASLAVYIVPLLAMIGGAILAAYIGAMVTPRYDQLSSVLGGLIGFSAAIAWLPSFGRAKITDARYRPRILRRVDETPGDGRGAPGERREIPVRDIGRA